MNDKIKIVPAYTVTSCKWCHFSSGLEIHSESECGCQHPAFGVGFDSRLFDDTTGNIPDWCPLEDVE